MLVSLLGLEAGKSRFSYSIVSGLQTDVYLSDCCKILFWFSDTLLILAKNFYNANGFF